MPYEFGDIDKYKKFLIGKTITNIQLSTFSDEGLVIAFNDESVLAFGFSGCEGIIKFIKPVSKTPGMTIDLKSF